MPSARGQAPSIQRRTMDHSVQQERHVPLVVLMGINPLLSVSDTRLARLVCKEWASELASAVHSIQLIPELWQTQSPTQANDLRHLTLIYRSFQHVRLLADSTKTVCPESVQRALKALNSIASLRSITICELSRHRANVAAVLQAFEALPDKVSSLEFNSVRLPGPGGLAGLTRLQCIQSLAIHSNDSNKLHQQHVQVVAQMPQLKTLSLSFRAVDGCLAEPLSLDCLNQLSTLQRLEVHYTGMPELASGIRFTSNDLLPGCGALTGLVLNRVPAPSLRGLFRLHSLRQLRLLQLSPLTEAQARSLAFCTQLQDLTVDNMPLQLLPRLAALSSLTALDVSVWDPPAASGAGLPGGPNVLALSGLADLKTVSISGPVLLAKDDVQNLSAAWQGLQSLTLGAILLDGSQGIAGFRNLTALRFKPWRAAPDRSASITAWVGNDEAVQASIQEVRGVTVAECDLPAGLVKLEGDEVTFANSYSSSTDAQTIAAADHTEQHVLGSTAAIPAGHTMTAGSTTTSPGSKLCESLKTLKLQYRPDGANSLASPRLPSSALLQRVTKLELQHPLITGQQLAAVVAACGSSLVQLKINTADVTSPFISPLTAIAYSSGVDMITAADHQGHKSSSCCSSSSTSGKAAPGSSFSVRSALNILSRAAAAATAPVAAAAGTFSTVAAAAAASAAAPITCSSSPSSLLGGPADFLFQQLGRALVPSLFTGASTGASGSDASLGLSRMGIKLNEGYGLDVLSQCTALEELSLVIGDAVLDADAWLAVASLPKLVKLTLAVASRAPAATAKNMAVWISRMQALRWLAISVDGPGARDVVESLLSHVSEALPACQVHRLKIALCKGPGT